MHSKVLDSYFLYYQRLDILSLIINFVNLGNDFLLLLGLVLRCLGLASPQVSPYFSVAGSSSVDHSGESEP
jgi:hypothetical protein